MATQVVNHTYRLKRGNEDAIERVNPLLEPGEPIVVFCNDGKTRLKIGDGKRYYSDLEFLGGSENKEVLTFPSRFDFPYPPDIEIRDAIFKATSEAKLWQWNQDNYRYEPLNDTEVEITLENIDTISGGNASELLEGNIYN